jgi:HEAT repeat protein
MRVRNCLVVVLGLLACSGCGKSTDSLITDLKSDKVGDRVAAARLLQHRQGDATKIVPALMAALEDKVDDVRWSAAIGLGYYGDKAKEAIPALEKLQSDSDARIREAARVAVKRINGQ